MSKKTGSHLKFKQFGTDVMGVELFGDKKRPEPEAFRIQFPGGDVEVVRTTDNGYFVHVRVDTVQDVREERAECAARFVDARLDICGRHTSEVDVGEFQDPGLYHVALKVVKQ